MIYKFLCNFDHGPRGSIKTPVGSFKTSAELVKQYLLFREECYEETHNDFFKFQFMDTGIGTVLIIEHPDTGEDFDATDYETW